MTIVLHQVGPAFGAPSMSPFCVRLECWLRMAEVPYTSRLADFRRAPKGKVPFVEIDGEVLGDSQLILERLVAKHGDKLDGSLTKAQRAEAHTIRRMIEEGTYFVGYYARWADDEGSKHTLPAFRANLPAPLRFVAPFVFPYESDFQRSARSHENLVAFRRRVRERYFPELGPARAITSTDRSP